MFFNSIDFAIFLPIVFLLFWGGKKLGLSFQNAIIVVSSYVFYGMWDWRFLSLIFFSTVIDFFMGNLIHESKSQKNRKIFLWISMCVNLGFLGFFKYYNFFLENFILAFEIFGQSITYNSIKIILPAGISFYTFQTMSYTIDVYKGKLTPTKNLLTFSAFVSFFPQLVAGPIERATNLLPQFYKQKKFDKDKAIDGLNQIIWGLFKKIVIADNCGVYADDIFNNYESYGSLTLILGAVYFSFRIYCDFSGYSDIAIGTAKLFGFNLMKNFSLPYFSRDIAEFWRRWHISLSTWFRDYLYIPLGGSKGGTWMKVRNTFIIFIVSGFWHGSKWTFIVWGFLNALYFLPLLLANRNRIHTSEIVAHDRILPSFREFFSMVGVYILSVFAWIFFRAENMKEALGYYTGIFQMDFKIERLGNEKFSFEMVLIIGLLLLIEWPTRRLDHPLVEGKYTILKSILVIFLIILLGNFAADQSFIYFQF